MWYELNIDVERWGLTKFTIAVLDLPAKESIATKVIKNWFFYKLTSCKARFVVRFNTR
jgi:hypothetical protein